MDTSHPLITQTTDIESKHILVLDHIHSLPVINKPWIFTEFVIAIGHGGTLKVRFNMHNVLFRKNDVVIIYPDHSIVPFEWSDDYDATLIIISTKWAKQQHVAFQVKHVLEHLLYPEYHLSDDQIEMLSRMTSVLTDISTIENENLRDQLFKNQMENFIRLINHFRAGDPGLDVSLLSARKRIAYRFYEDLVENYKIARDTKFYADKQHLTAKHFGTTVYDVTGIHVSDWVARYVVTQAKILLQNRPDLTVAEIGHTLGFEEPSDFGRYFKRQTNTSPAAYRASLIKN